MTPINYKQAADLLSVDPAVIKAIKKTEVNSKGTLADGRLKILFEGHKFWEQLEKWGVRPETVKPTWNDILYKEWTRKHYIGGPAEWDRWSKAVKLCKLLKVPTAAALNSASYGSFQIMGFNHAACGYASAHEMIADFNLKGEPAQLIAVCRLIKSERWDRHLKPVVHVNNFVEAYNGKGYRENKYHIKFKNNLLFYGFTNFIFEK